LLSKEVNESAGYSDRMRRGEKVEQNQAEGGTDMTAIKHDASGQPATATSGRENWWEFLQRARRELEASGAMFRRGLDIAAEIDQIRSEHERPFNIHWEMEWQKHHAEA
jgi:hypothetical protein